MPEKFHRVSTPRWNPLSATFHTVCSVYVTRPHRGTGAGGVALAALIDAATKAGFWKLVSRIFPENTTSLALMARSGFREVGIYQRHGRLDGQWRDCIIVERLLGVAAV